MELVKKYLYNKYPEISEDEPKIGRLVPFDFLVEFCTRTPGIIADILEEIEFGYLEK